MLSEFATLVASELQAGMLRYSGRTELLRWAELHGIGRFDANLVIATVQHQMGQVSVQEPAREASHRWLRPLVWVACIQACIALAIWLIFVR